MADVATLIDAAYRAGFRGDALRTIVAIALAESGGNEGAVGTIAPGEYSVGPWQINLPVHGGVTESTRARARDPYTAAQWAYDISSGGTDFNPWTTYTGGNYQNFLNQVGAGGGGGGGMDNNQFFQYLVGLLRQTYGTLDNEQIASMLRFLQSKGVGPASSPEQIQTGISQLSDVLRQISVTAQPQPDQGLQGLYNSWQQSGLSQPEYTARLQQAQGNLAAGLPAEGLALPKGYEFLRMLLPLIQQWQAQPLTAGEMTGYIPGSYLGTTGMIPTTAERQFQAGMGQYLAQLLASPQDQPQLDILMQSAGQPGNSLPNALLSTPTVGSPQWGSLMDVWNKLVAAPNFSTQQGQNTTTSGIQQIGDLLKQLGVAA